MNSNDRLSQEIPLPRVVGFDMPPSLTMGDDTTPQVMVALLSTAPDRHWIEAFVEHTSDYRAQHELIDMRVNGQHLVVMGPPSRLRELTSELRRLVHRVSRSSLQRRVLARVEPGKLKAPQPAGMIENKDPAVGHDLAQVARVPGVAALLETMARETGMRFAAVARVTESRWTACAVYDAIEFGLQPGQDLVLETTICNEIRQHGHTVSFNQASTDPQYADHRTPIMYGFQSYISVPIFRRNGQFFGTLCAIDPEPARLDETTVHTIEMFARAIGAELDAPGDETADHMPG